MESHLSRPALVRLLSGQAVPTEVEGMVPHLASCRHCWDLAAQVVAELKRENKLAYSSDARSAVLALLAEEEKAAIGLLRARGWWAELLALSRVEQIAKIRSTAALQTPLMFGVVLEAARAAAPVDPFVGEETALVASSLAEWLPEPRYSLRLKSDLQAEAMVVVANCRRLAADWKGSQAALTAASNFLDRGTGDPARQARFLSIYASLATAIGHFETALGLLGRAAELYEAAHEPCGALSVAVQEANTLLAAFRYQEAITKANAALARLTPSDARLEMLARSIVTESLIGLGRPSEALRNFAATRSLYEQLWGRRTQLAVQYLEALLLDALGCARESEKSFRGLIAEYIDDGLYKEAFITYLSFFETLFRRGAFGKAKQVYKDAAKLLDQVGTGCHAQMKQVWRNLFRSLEAESLKEYQLHQVRRYVSRHWVTPAPHPPFSPAS